MYFLFWLGDAGGDDEYDDEEELILLKALRLLSTNLVFGCTSATGSEPCPLARRFLPLELFARVVVPGLLKMFKLN